MSLTDEPRSLRNGTPNRGYLAGGRHWAGRDGRRDTRGANGRGAKLTETQARDIKARPAWQKHADIALEHGVSRGQVAAIRQGRAWAHLRVEEGAS